MIPLLAAAALPIVQELMSKGLDALAGAVANKGKEFVEDKLGNAALFFVDRRHRCSACAHSMRGCP